MARPKTAAFLIVVSITACCCFSGEAVPERSNSTSEFGQSIVMVRMRTTMSDGRFTDGYLEGARVRRLGDTAFLVGVMRCDSKGDAGCPGNGVTIWLPLAEVAEIAESKNWEGMEKLELVPAVEKPKVNLSAAPDVPQDISVLVTTASRRFRIPFAIEAYDKERIAKLILFRSKDEGKTWRPFCEAIPSDARFTVSLDEDGPNWFAAQLVGKEGEKSPARPEDFKPVFKVLVKGVGSSPAKGEQASGHVPRPD